MNDPAGPTVPGAAEVRAQLERILASRCFEQAARSSGFLRFVVEQTLAGQGERLKGYTIAVEVFGRPPDFDAQTDPLVRVEAGRLRRRLIEYYADEGRNDPVRIELPRGSYSVVSSYAADNTPETAAPLAGTVPAARAAPNAKVLNRRRWRRLRSVAVIGVLVVAAAVIYVPQREVTHLEHGDGPTGVAGRPPIVVLPFEALGGARGTAELAAALTEEIFLVLDSPEALVVPAVASGSTSPVMPGYVLSGSVRETDGHVRITARIVRTDTGTQIWSAAYDEHRDSLRSAAGQRHIARLVALAAEPYGPIFGAELERMRRMTAHEPTTRNCVLRYYEYRRVLSPAEHASAFECFEHATRRDAESAEAWAGLSLLYSDAWAHGFAGQGGHDAALGRAREAARRAMDIDGRNLHANLALISVQYFGGAEFRDAAERVLTSWPENAEAQAFLGVLFVLSGDAERGSALVANAIEWTPEVPSGYYASSSLAALRRQRYDDALALALRMDAPDWPLGQLIWAAAAALDERADLAARAHARLLELDPEMVTTFPDVLKRWRVEPVLASEIERGLGAAAGLD